MTRYSTTETVWRWKADNGWHFMNIDKETSKQIKETKHKTRGGFGSVKVEVTLGKSIWQTSLFPDSKRGCYILPLKAKIRKLEDIHEGDRVSITFRCI
ncbi:MAG: DUF1905 domain-containing protein [bacterium]|nr:DUF1905 domain-containing protein [bacterium]